MYAMCIMDIIYTLCVYIINKSCIVCVYIYIYIYLLINFRRGLRRLRRPRGGWPLLPLGFGPLFALIPWVWAPFRPDPFPRLPRGAPRQPKTAPRGSKSRPRLPTEAPRASQDRPLRLQIPSQDRSPARVWATFRPDPRPRLPTVAPGEPKTAHIGPKSRPRPPT